MTMRRMALAGLAVAAMIGLSGCGPSGGDRTIAGSAATTAASADPKAELAAAATKLQEQSVRMRVSMGATMSVAGVADHKNRKADITMTTSDAGQNSDVTMRLVGADLYMRFDESLDGSEWLHVDAAKIPAGSQLNVDNIIDAHNFLVGIGEVERSGDGRFTGVLDMTKARNADAQSLAFLGEKAKAVPFTAMVDAQGRLTELVIDMAALGMPAQIGTTIRAQYSDFGIPVTVEAPAKDEVQEMPAEVLKALIG